MDIEAMKSEVYQWACSKGWEPDSGRTFDDEFSLMHSEVSEATDTYRIRKLEYYTDATGKPDDVASEFADVLIRICHYSSVGRFELDEVLIQDLDSNHIPFGRQCAILHLYISKAYEAYSEMLPRLTNYYMTRVLADLVQFSEINGFDLEREFRRKMDYNYSRSWRHGGKAM